MDTFEKVICRVAFGLLFAGLLLSTVSQGGARGASSGAQGSSAQSPAKLTAADQKFLKKAADDGLDEIELGKLAVQKAPNRQVKNFGQRMIDDHGKANDQLKAMASNKGVELPQKTGSKNKARKERLAKLSGDQFDNAYMAEMLKDHKEDVAEFLQESKAGGDADVKAFATTTLPTLESHLKLAESIVPNLKAQHHSGQKPSPAIAQAHQSGAANRGTSKSR
jgi:putative membrane protein